jgi:uncharacterized protein
MAQGPFMVATGQGLQRAGETPLAAQALTLPAGLHEYAGVTRQGRDPKDAPFPPPPPVHAWARESGLLIERNAAVVLRDGTTLYVDIYRADGVAGEKDLGAIVGWGPYGKHRTGRRYALESGVDPAWVSAYAGFEAVDPMYWCPRGYAVVYPDPRGTWWSQGDMRHGGIVESLDCYDLIEWVGTRDWCNGKVGLSGVSYLAAIQYQVAPLKPPHLAAINPWEAFSDWYREFAYHGGIRETGFLPYASDSINWSTGRTEDTQGNVLAHPLHDDYWQSKQTCLEDIEVPAFVVASWSDQGFHTRGTLACFRQIRSQQKWLLVHGRKKWGHFYDPENVRRLQAFFDHFLLGTDDSVLNWPRVQLEVRDRAYVQHTRAESDWPIRRQRLVPLYLDAGSASLSAQPQPAEGSTRYASEDPRSAASFDYVFPVDTELTGHMKLKLWAAAATHNDLDLFVAIQKVDRHGEVVGFHYYASFDTGPVALGWLRASHRALDPFASSPEQPVHLHCTEQLLSPGEIVPLEIEIWPSSTRFRQGERLRVVVQGSDIYPYPHRAPGTPLALHTDTRNRGDHVIWSGGRFDSHLLVPVIDDDAPQQV